MKAQPASLGGEADASWLAVNTHPRREAIAIVNLRRQWFTTYCPMLTARVRHGRRIERALRPMFPGYVFVAVSPSHQRWQPILSTHGVRSVVRSGERPSLLPKGFIESLHAREVEGAIVRPLAPYCVGQTVAITRGAFDGVIATIVGLKEHDRLILLNSLLQARLIVDAADVTDVRIGGSG